MTSEPSLSGGGAEPLRNRWRQGLLALPVLALALWIAAPLALGGRTLFLRDVFNTHLERKWTQAEALRHGRLPIVDARRDGQPNLGNPNSVPLYPDNLLYLVAPPFWAFNAHFWLHLVLAPLALFWLARVWGLSRPGAWTAATLYGASGYVLSNLSFYNLIAAVALAPALAAALLASAGPGRRKAGWRVAAVAGLWALLLLGGDPMTAAVALVLGLSAPLARYGRRGLSLAAHGLPLALGTLLAAPQLVEFLRILPFTVRGYRGFSATAATAASFHPAVSVEWLVPFFFGRPDLDFWGQRFFTGNLPFYNSLYPGLLALLLVVAAGRPRHRLGLWAWGAAGAGLFFALGRFNPLVLRLWEVPGAGLLRLPIKLWLPVAVGCALVGGAGVERLLAGKGRGPLIGALGGLWVLWLGFGALLLGAPARLHDAVRWLIPSRFSERVVVAELAHLGTVVWTSLALLAGLTLLLVRLRGLPGSRGTAVVAALLGIHVAGQWLLLRPLLATDGTEAYRQPPALLAAAPVDELLVHGDSGGLFGPVGVDPEDFPGASLAALERYTFERLYPQAGILWGRHYAFHTSPEGLDSFLTRVTADAVRELPDAQRIRLLAASGVDRLLLGRSLDEEAVRLVEEVTPAGAPVHVYRLHGGLRRAAVVGNVRWARDPARTLGLLLDPRFDPRRGVVLAGNGPPRNGPEGTVRVVAWEEEAARLEVEVPASGGVVVLARTFLPVYRATVDGVATTLEVANLHRIAVPVPPGEHEVIVEVDRWPFRLASVVSLLALLLIASRSRRSPSAGAGTGC